MSGEPAVTIEHLTGRRAGTVETYDARVRTIEIARDADDRRARDRAHDVLPIDPGDLLVSTAHARLERAADGRLTLTPHYGTAGRLLHVALERADGAPRPLTGPEPLPSDAVLRLGGADGLRLRVRHDPEAIGAPSGLTFTNDPVEWTRDIVSRHRRSTIAGLALLAIALVAFGAWAIERIFTAEFDLAAAIEHQAAAELRQAARSFDVLEMARLEDAAHLVTENGTPKGTAWPIGPFRLATNAHVARCATGRPPPGQNVRHHDGTVRRVTGCRAHPGYAAFRRFTRETMPGFENAEGRFVAFEAGSAYDVAILTVDGPPLPAPLPIASRETLMSMKPGDAIAYAGFPVEGTLGGAQAAQNAQPEVKLGHVSSLRDVLGGAGWPGEALIVHHTIPAIGGASGAPVINTRGEVVALVSGGNVVRVPDGDEGLARAMNAVATNFAQRVDLLASLDADPGSLRSHWTRLARSLPDRRESFERRMVRGGQAHFRAEVASRTASSAGSAPGNDRGGERRAQRGETRHTFEVEAGVPLGILVYAEKGRRVAAAVALNGEPVTLPAYATRRTPDTMIAWLVPKESGQLEVGAVLEPAPDPAGHHVVLATFARP